MTLTRNAKAKLIRHFGEIFVEEPHRLKLYSQDFNSMITKELRKDKIIPDGILGVRTEEELMKLYEVATEENIPLIIRGSSSGDVGGAVPSENGIVVDLKHLNTSPIVEPIEQKMITGASIDFKDIQSVAILNGFSLCCYPSNLYSATPGGWVAQGGYGLGSLRYGSALDQIIELEVILPNGEKKIFAEKDDFKLFFGSHGTLGVITNITLKLKFDTPLNHHGCTYDNYKG